MNGTVDESESKPVRTLVLDAGPLITQPSSSLQQYADTFYTTPGVQSELKDENSRRQLIIWGDKLQVRHPKSEYIQKVIKFAKLTGDYPVLSLNDIHIIALAYELEAEMNNGEWRLRKYPGEILEYEKKKRELDAKQPINKEDEVIKDHNSEQTEKKKTRRRGGKRQREKMLALLEREKNNTEALKADKREDVSSVDCNTEDDKESEFLVKAVEDIDLNSTKNLLEEDYGEEDDDGEWITQENLQEEILKDSGSHDTVESTRSKRTVVKVALTTGDFACQNVSMQIGINLLNSMSGKKIRRVRNYMYRCHACFRLTPIPKDGTPKIFCSRCGGNTLLRCAVSIDSATGKVTPHLKANFQWIRRGERYSLPSPLSKNQQKLQGNAGYQHNKARMHKSLQEPLILREDQKEFQKAVKNDQWQRRQNEKILQDWIGGGSADNYVSPFASNNALHKSSVRVGRGRYVNSSRGKRK